MGFTPEEWIGSSLVDHCTSDHFEVMAKLVAEAIGRLPDITPIVFETEMLNKDGNAVPLEIVSKVITDDEGEPIALQGVTRDISDRKQAEMERNRIESQLLQAQKIESVGRLAGGVAHDYNNMLTVIAGYTAIAMEKVPSGDTLQKDLQEIHKAAMRSTEITRQLLAFARKQTISPKVLDLNITVEGMLKMLRRLIGEDIDLSWQPSPALWPVFLDSSQLNQILANLCVNARDAIGGVGKITIETDNVTFDQNYCFNNVGFTPGDFVMLAVSDDGCGMDKETQEKLFEPFFTTKSMGEGTGLGLATIYGIVKQNDGFINVYSEPGEGTTFKIYLPRQIEMLEEIQTEETFEIPKGRGETILIVEDEQSILMMSKTILERLDYTVIEADDPNRAIALAREYSGEINLVLTDVVMPEMNGREMAKSLQSLYPNIKILFMSGYTANVIAHRGVLDKGINFLQKPFSNSELAIKVRQILDGQNRLK